MSINPNRPIITYDNVMLLQSAIDAHRPISNSGDNLSHVPLVQSVSFGFDYGRTTFGELGSTETIYDAVQQSPSVEFTVSVLEDFNKMFSTFRKIGETGSINTSGLNQDRNFYCVIGANRGGGDITGQVSGFSGLDCISFGNCFLNSFSTSQNVNGLMESSYTFTSSNVQAQKIENKVLYFNDFENLDEASYKPASYASGNVEGATGFNGHFFTGGHDDVSGRMFTGALVSYSAIDDGRGLTITSGHIGGLINLNDTDGLGITESIGVSGVNGQKSLAIYDINTLNGFAFSGFTPIPHEPGTAGTNYSFAGTPTDVPGDAGGGHLYDSEDIYLVSGTVRNTEGGSLIIRFQTGDAGNFDNAYQSTYQFANVTPQEFFATGNFGKSPSGVLWVAHRKSGSMYLDLTGFKNVEANQLNYRFINAPGCTFFEAITGAEMHNGRLVCIDTPEKLARFENFITGTGSRNGDSSTYAAPTGFVNAGGHSHGHNSNTYRGWIGLSDSGSEAAGTLTEKREDFKWINNVANVHTGNDLWSSLEPNNVGGLEHYVHLGFNSSGAWNDNTASPSSPVHGFYMEQITTASFISDLTIRNLNKFEVQAPSFDLTGDQNQNTFTHMSGLDFYYSNNTGKAIPYDTTHIEINRNSFEPEEYVVVDTGSGNNSNIFPDNVNSSIKVFLQSAPQSHIGAGRDLPTDTNQGVAKMHIDIDGVRVYDGIQTGIETSYIERILLNNKFTDGSYNASGIYVPSGSVFVRGYPVYYPTGSLVIGGKHQELDTDAGTGFYPTGFCIAKANTTLTDNSGFALYRANNTGVGQEVIFMTLDGSGTLSDGTLSATNITGGLDSNIERVNHFRSHAISQLPQSVSGANYTGYSTTLKRGISMAKIKHRDGKFEFSSGILIDLYGGDNAVKAGSHVGHYSSGKALEFLQDFETGDILALISRDSMNTTSSLSIGARKDFFNELSGEFKSKRAVDVGFRDQLALLAIKGKGPIYEEYLNSSGTNAMAPDSQYPAATVYLPKNTSNFLIEPNALQSMNFDIPVARKQINSLGKKHPTHKKAVFPSRGTFDVSNIVSNIVNTGDSTMLRSETPITQNLEKFLNHNSSYTINLSGRHIDKTTFDLQIQNAKIESQNFDSQIGSAATSNMSFSFDMQNLVKKDHLNNLDDLYLYIDRQNTDCYTNGSMTITDLAYKPFVNNTGRLNYLYRQSPTSSNFITGMVFRNETGFVFNTDDESLLHIRYETGSPSPSTARATGAFTYLAWVKPKDFDGSQTIMRQSFSNEERHKFGLGYSGLRFESWASRRFRGGGTNVHFDVRPSLSTVNNVRLTAISMPLDTGKYQQIAVTYEESTGSYNKTENDYSGIHKFYVNEHLVGTTGHNRSASAQTSSQPFLIGGEHQTNGLFRNSFEGEVAIAAVYVGKTLSSGEIADNFNRLKGRFDIPDDYT